MSAKLHTVHVRINDAATGQPTPCRVRFTGADGTYYAPLGRLTEFAKGVGEDIGGNVRLQNGQRWAYINGSCEIDLPAGTVRINVTKGFEYQSISDTIDLKAGQLSIRVNLTRRHDARNDGWYSGDIHAEFLTPHAALLEAAAEDLAVANILATLVIVPTSNGEARFAIPNIDAFSGQQPALEMPGHLVVVNTLNRHEKLGELILLNCHRVIYPLAFGEPYGPDNWTLADWCDQCHRKGGLVVSNGCAGLAELILGKVDAYKAGIAPQEDGFVLDLHRDLLELGFRIPIVAGSEKRTNTRALGSFRTYARLPAGEPFTYRSWIEAVRSGRTFITNGPLVYLTVNGLDPGSVVKLDRPGEKVHVRAEIHSETPMNSLSIHLPETEAIKVDCNDSSDAVVLEREIPINGNGYIDAWCIGSGRQAAVSPIYIEVAGSRPLERTEVVAKECRGKVLQLLEDQLAWINTRGRFENEGQRERLVGVFLAAKTALLCC